VALYLSTVWHASVVETRHQYGTVVQWLRCQTRNQEFAGLNPGRNDFCSYMSTSSIIWYWPKAGDPLLIDTAWKKVMAAYRFMTESPV